MEKKLNLQERITKATDTIQFYQKASCMDFAREIDVMAEFRFARMKRWTIYLRNTCMMHGIPFSKMLL